MSWRLSRFISEIQSDCLGNGCPFVKSGKIETDAKKVQSKSGIAHWAIPRYKNDHYIGPSDIIVPFLRRAFMIKLAVVQLRIKPILSQKLLMTPLFYNIAIAHNQNNIRLTNG